MYFGGHGLTTWADTSEECEKRSLDAIKMATIFIGSHGKKDPFGKVVAKYSPLEESARHLRASKLAPILRGIASQDARMVGHYSDANVVLDFISREKLGELAALGTSCPCRSLLANKNLTNGSRYCERRSYRRGYRPRTRTSRAVSRDLLCLLPTACEARSPAEVQTQRSSWCQALECSALEKAVKLRELLASST